VSSTGSCSSQTRCTRCGCVRRHTAVWGCAGTCLPRAVAVCACLPPPLPPPPTDTHAHTHTHTHTRTRARAHQANIYAPQCSFFSFKQVVRQLGSPCPLVSLHSTSKVRCDGAAAGSPQPGVWRGGAKNNMLTHVKTHRCMLRTHGDCTHRCRVLWASVGGEAGTWRSSTSPRTCTTRCSSWPASTCAPTCRARSAARS
jgi:hypothetical protein